MVAGLFGEDVVAEVQQILDPLVGRVHDEQVVLRGDAVAIELRDAQGNSRQVDIRYDYAEGSIAAADIDTN